MRKVAYLDDMSGLESEYKEIFGSDSYATQFRWNKIRKVIVGLKESGQRGHLYQKKLKNLLIAPISKLAALYEDYKRIKDSLSEEQRHELEIIFHYNMVSDGAQTVPALQPDIARFFMRHSVDLRLDVCHYCELSYINAYGWQNIYPTLADMLLKADLPTLKRYIRKSDGGQYEDSKYNNILGLRKKCKKKNIVAEFDNLYVSWHNEHPYKSEILMDDMRNHFDLDHLLPKSECPIIGLSLYNFVPSCPTCNERLKRTAELTSGISTVDLSPTSSNYTFNDDITIRIIPIKGVKALRYQEHPNDFYIAFLPESSKYQKEIQLFRLEERYNYHKMEALRLADLYNDYDDYKRKMIAELFDGIKTEHDVYEDFFGLKYAESNGRIMYKLKKDILTR